MTVQRVLVLRPEPGASATVDRARASGIEAIAVPLFTVEPRRWEAPPATAFDALLLTSANAVRYAGDQLDTMRALSVYAVGERTAEAARHAGFDIAAVGEAGVDCLLGSIESGLRLLHLCGTDRREPVSERQKITAVPIYTATAIEAPDLTRAPGSLALIHSPRAGKRFAELVQDRGTIQIAAISPAAAEAAGEGWRSVAVADHPNDQALLALAARLCNKPDPK